MSVDSLNKNDLSFWLDYIESLNIKEIQLGLNRVIQVAQNLGVEVVADKTIMIAGTNGKGSCVAAMEVILRDLGYKVGCYTSPHILRFNERIKLDGAEIAEEILCAAFLAVENARGDIKLTYFEFTTLVAFLIFSKRKLDFALLEVGLGGRLDAVNIIEADVAVITSIDLDHQEWLGKDRESIGYEKAGIIKKNRPVVYGDSNPTKSVLATAESLNSKIFLKGRDFDHQIKTEDKSFNWSGGRDMNENISGLPIPNLAIENVSIGMQALSVAGIEIDVKVLRSSLRRLCLPGRFEKCVDALTGVSVVLDVAHNPAAASMLASNISRELSINHRIKQISVVIGLMADKDVRGFIAELRPFVDSWYVAGFDDPRAMPVKNIAACLDNEDRIILPDDRTFLECYNQACADLYSYQKKEAGSEGLIIVTGSFLCVSAVQESVKRNIKP